MSSVFFQQFFKKSYKIAEIFRLLFSEKELLLVMFVFSLRESKVIELLEVNK